MCPTAKRLRFVYLRSAAHLTNSQRKTTTPKEPHESQSALTAHPTLKISRQVAPGSTLALRPLPPVPPKTCHATATLFLPLVPQNLILFFCPVLCEGKRNVFIKGGLSMKRTFRLTTSEFIAALNRAACDDRRWPWLCSHKWLVDHVRVKDDEVILDTKGDNAPRPATGDLHP